MTEETYEELCERYSIDPEQGMAIWIVEDIPEEPSEEFMRELEGANPEYRRCGYCEGDVNVEVASFERHLRERHGLEPGV